MVFIISVTNKLLDDEIFKGTPGVWELLLSKRPNDNIYTRKDYDKYAKLMLKPTPFIVITTQKVYTPKVVRVKNG